MQNIIFVGLMRPEDHARDVAEAFQIVERQYRNVAH